MVGILGIDVVFVGSVLCVWISFGDSILCVWISIVLDSSGGWLCC